MCAKIFAAAMCNCVLLKMLVFVKKNSRICVKSPKKSKNRPALPVKFAKMADFCGFAGGFWAFLVCLPFPAPKLAYFLSNIKRVGKFRMSFLFAIVN